MLTGSDTDVERARRRESVVRAARRIDPGRRRTESRVRLTGGNGKMVRMPGLLDDERRRIREFVACLPTTALLGRVAEVSLPAWLVWVSPWRAGCCSTACRGTTRAWGVTRSSVSHVPTRQVPVQPCPTASATARAKSV